MKTKETDLNELTVKQFIKSLQPKDEEIRKQLDFGYSYDGKSVIIYEIRPIWDCPSEIQHIEFAKIRFFKSRRQWNLYLMRASGKWELYAPFPESSHLEKLIKIIKEDKHGCFFG